MLLTPSAACSPRYRRPPLLQPSLLSPASSATATPATFPRHTIEDCSPSIVVASVLSSTTPHPAAPTAFPRRPSLSLLGRCSTRLSQIASTSESHGGDLIIQRYDLSDWRVRLLQCLYSLKGARQVRGQGRNKEGVEAGGRKEATTSPEGLSYPKAKRRLERRWTRRSTTVPQRRIYRSRRKGCRCKSTDSRAIGLAAPWYRRGGTSVESSIPCSHGGRALVVKGAKEVENAKANSKYQDRAEAKKLHKTNVDGLLIKIAESEGLQVDAGVLDQGTK
ncbi:hypothetical protein BHM03_00042909 [Ensete ventricosum]|nr:hypothetical protein BHM03_00042909 [Ensete ventricosum]